MACFSRMLRRASSSVVPLAIRSSRSLKTFNGVAAASDIGGNQRGAGSRRVLHFSTETEAAKVGQRDGEENVKPAINGIVSEKNAKRAIDRIVSEKNVKRAINRIVSEIDPKPMKEMAAPEELSNLKVDYYDRLPSYVGLKWEYGDEIIKVSPPAIYKYGRMNSYDDFKCPKRLDVTLTKRGCEVQLEFDVSVYPDWLSITRLSMSKKVVEDHSGSEKAKDENYDWVDDPSYGGPYNFSEVVDENFRKDLLFYLEVRGFNLSTTKFLYNHIKNRHRKSTDKNRMDWLKNFKRFFEY